MSTWGSESLFTGNWPVVSVFGRHGYGSFGGAVGTPANAAWPSSNRAYYMPVRISSPFLIAQLFWYNGGTVTTGNVDCGVYSSDGTRIISTGSTAQSGSNALQSVSVTNTWIGPGLFYLALAMDSSVVGVFLRVVANHDEFTVLGSAQQASAFPLPATATMVNNSSLILALCGMSNRSFV